MRRHFSNSGHGVQNGGRMSHRFEVGVDAAQSFGIGAPYHQAWEYRQLPGAGANQWAWETLALPMYTPIGAGTRNRRQFLATASCPVMVAVQGVELVPISGSPVMGDYTGQFATQPLMDMSEAEQQGLVYPSYNTAPNQFELPSHVTG